MPTISVKMPADFTFPSSGMKDAPTCMARWDLIGRHNAIMVNLLEFAVRQKCHNSHANIKKDGSVPGAREACHAEATAMVAALEAGDWGERGGRTSDPVTVHARAITQAWSKVTFAGLRVTKEGWSVDKGSQAEATFAALQAKMPDADLKTMYDRAFGAKMSSEAVQADARKRAEADAKNAAGLEGLDL